ncbi:FAD-dependent oxidoreductase [Elusimicrobiota bacterium]
MKNKRSEKNYILGAGVTGLSAGITSGRKILERMPYPGGICSSYQIDCPDKRFRAGNRSSKNAFRFEVGGGHWIFGGDKSVVRFIRSLVPIRSYTRNSSVYFHKLGSIIPFPIQNNLSCLPTDLSKRALSDIIKNHNSAYPPKARKILSLYLKHNFGATLNDLFFRPFHDKYTANLTNAIAPQDPYKTPIDLDRIKAGASDQAKSKVGYNATFLYPVGGLNKLVSAMAAKCDIAYRSRVLRISLKNKMIRLESGEDLPYNSILSTLPLHNMMEMTGLRTSAPDPCTSVLVLNIAGTRGRKCPRSHWLYTPESASGFHRTGFYSNVERDFVPGRRKDLVSFYIEFSFRENRKPSQDKISLIAKRTEAELKRLKWMGDAIICDPTWIDAAYTWSYPDSTWKERSIKALKAHNILSIGRYGRWVFQGIAESIKEGLAAGKSFKRR